MAIRSKIHTVLIWADNYLSDNRERLTNEEQQKMRSVLDTVRDALSDIQTDNSAQYVIYTGITAEHEFVYESSAKIDHEDYDICAICDEIRAHSSHAK